MRITAVTAPLVIGFLISSCQHHESEPLVPAAGTVRQVESSVDQLAKARCDYAERCKQIGASMRYSSREHCMNVMRADARRDLNQCHEGVDEKDFRECLTQIANEDCSGAFRGMDEYKECHLDDLCTH